MHSIKWTNVAIRSYTNLISRTQKFETALDLTLQTISQLPLSFPLTPEYSTIRKAVINKNHSLYYNIHDSKNVVLLFFLDNRTSTEQLEKLFKQSEE